MDGVNFVVGSNMPETEDGPMDQKVRNCLPYTSSGLASYKLKLGMNDDSFTNDGVDIHE